MVPALSISGCLNTNNTPPTSEGTGTGTGTGTENCPPAPPCPACPEHVLSQVEQDAAYALLHSLSQKILNKTNRKMTFTSTQRGVQTVSLVDTEGMDPEDVEALETMLAGMSIEAEINNVVAYDLDTLNAYAYTSEYNSETEEYETNNEKYVVTDEGVTNRYSKYVYSDGSTSIESNIVGEEFLEKDFFENNVAKASGLVILAGAIGEKTTYADFKADLMKSVNLSETGVTSQDLTFTMTLKDGVYTISAVVDGKSIESLQMGQAVLNDAVVSAQIEIKFNATQIISQKVNAEVVGYTDMEVPDSDPINTKLVMDSTIETAYSTNFDDSGLDRDFTEFGTPELLTTWAYFHVNGVKIGSKVSNYTDTVSEQELIERVSSLPEGVLESLLNGVYLNEEFTIGYENAVKEWPTYDFNVYSEINEDAIEDGKAVVIVKQVGEYLSSYGNLYLVNLADLTDNKLVLDDYYLNHPNYTPSKVLVDGVEATGDIILNNKQAVIITLHYDYSNNQ